MDTKTLRAGILALLLAVAALVSAATSVHAAPHEASSLDIKEAAMARAARLAPQSRVGRIDIDRVAGGYATVTLYPDLQSSDALRRTVVLKQEGEGWVGVEGPGTSFPPGARGGAPDELFEDDNPYTGTNSAAAIARLNVRRAIARSNALAFEYPGNALLDTSTNTGEMILLGPEFGGQNGTGTAHGRAYDIRIAPINETSAGPLDEYGYRKMLSLIAEREAQNGAGGAGTKPEIAAYYSLDNADVFQIDWMEGSSMLRQFFVSPPGGGPVVLVETRVSLPADNPAQEQAESAMNLVLHTLEQPMAQTHTMIMPRTGESGGDSAPLALWAISLAAALMTAGSTALTAHVRRRNRK